MVRIARTAELKEGCQEKYIKRHKEVWPEVIKLIKDSGVKNYSIYISGNDLFSYLEVDDWGKAKKKMFEKEVGAKFQKYMAPLMDSENPESPWVVIEEIFSLD